MTPQTIHTTYRIVRDDGELMEAGLPDRPGAERRLRQMYDPGEYLVIEWNEYVDATPLPFYPGPFDRLVAWVRRIGRRS